MANKGIFRTLSGGAGTTRKAVVMPSGGTAASDFQPNLLGKGELGIEIQLHTLTIAEMPSEQQVAAVAVFRKMSDAVLREFGDPGDNSGAQTNYGLTPGDVVVLVNVDGTETTAVYMGHTESYVQIAELNGYNDSVWRIVPFHQVAELHELEMYTREEPQEPVTLKGLDGIREFRMREALNPDDDPQHSWFAAWLEKSDDEARLQALNSTSCASANKHQIAEKLNAPLQALTRLVECGADAASDLVLRHCFAVFLREDDDSHSDEAGWCEAIATYSKNQKRWKPLLEKLIGELSVNEACQLSRRMVRDPNHAMFEFATEYLELNGEYVDRKK